MYAILWEYFVDPEKQSEFEKAYSAHGDWAELFNKSTGFLGTELMRDSSSPHRYLTIDRWESKEEYEAFLSGWKEEYNRLDKQCEDLTISEICLGQFEYNFA